MVGGADVESAHHHVQRRMKRRGKLGRDLDLLPRFHQREHHARDVAAIVDPAVVATHKPSGLKVATRWGASGTSSGDDEPTRTAGPMVCQRIGPSS